MIVSTPTQPVIAKQYTDAELKATFIKMPVPDYPIQMRRMRVEGRGVFRLFVDEHGRVDSVTVIKSTGYRVLDKSCLKTLGRWEAVRGTRREINVPVSFTMKAAFPDFYLENGRPAPSRSAASRSQ